MFQFLVWGHLFKTEKKILKLVCVGRWAKHWQRGKLDQNVLYGKNNLKNITVKEEVGRGTTIHEFG